MYRYPYRDAPGVGEGARVRPVGEVKGAVKIVLGARASQHHAVE